MKALDQPWKQPGFSFQIPGWPPRFESSCFPSEQLKKDAKGSAISAKQSSNRDQRLAAGLDPQEPRL